MKLEREACKLLYAKGQHREATEALAATLAVHKDILSDLPVSSQAHGMESRELAARSLLLLVRWLQTDVKNLSQVAPLVGVGSTQDDSSKAVKNLQLLVDMETSLSQNHSEADCCKSYSELSI